LGVIFEEKVKCFIYFQNIFKIFNIKVEKQTGKVIKVLRSNNGGEFISSQFTNYCQDSGIRRQFSQAYTPQQNGVIERKNWAIVERARSILLESRLPINLWTKVVNTTNYVLNCSPF
jgi:transposase InsO family protein